MAETTTPETTTKNDMVWLELSSGVRAAISSRLASGSGDLFAFDTSAAATSSPARLVVTQLGAFDPATGDAPAARAFCAGLSLAAVDGVRRLAYGACAREVYDELCRAFEAAVAAALDVPPGVLPPPRPVEDIRLLAPRLRGPPKKQQQTQEKQQSKKKSAATTVVPMERSPPPDFAISAPVVVSAMSDAVAPVPVREASVRPSSPTLRPHPQLLRRTSSLGQIEKADVLPPSQQQQEERSEEEEEEGLLHSTPSPAPVVLAEATPPGTPPAEEAAAEERKPRCRPHPKLEQRSRVLDMSASSRGLRSPSLPGDTVRPALTQSAGAPAVVKAPSPLLERKGASPVFVRPKQPPMGFARGSPELLVSLILAETKLSWCSPDLIDYWSTRHMESEQWISPLPPADPAVRAIINRSIAPSAGYSIECGWGSMTHLLPIEADRITVLNSEEDFGFYKQFFSTFHHENLLALEGPCVVSLETHFRGCCKAIVRTPAEDKRVLLPADKTMKALEAFCPEVQGLKFKKAKSAKIIYDLVSYEEQNIHSTYKFGLLYAKPHENDEDSLFGCPEGSPAYNEFLEYIGEVVQLQGFKQFRGGLDVRTNATGTHSVFSTLRNIQIMWHCCTMLPLDPNDQQKLERKRHIGNDVVVLVFKDQGDPTDTFNPRIITSHFIHCVFVITPELDENGKTTHYWLSVANKPGVPPYAPFLPQVPRFAKGPAFRQFLLTKMINAERTALGCGEFTSVATARRKQLEHLCTEYADTK